MRRKSLYLFHHKKSNLYCGILKYGPDDDKPAFKELKTFDNELKEQYQISKLNGWLYYHNRIGQFLEIDDLSDNLKILANPKYVVLTNQNIDFCDLSIVEFKIETTMNYKLEINRLFLKQEETSVHYFLDLL